MSRSKSDEEDARPADVSRPGDVIRQDREEETSSQIPASCPADVGQSVDRAAKFMIEVKENADVSVPSSPLAKLDLGNEENSDDAPEKESRSHLIQRHKRVSVVPPSIICLQTPSYPLNHCRPQNA